MVYSVILYHTLLCYGSTIFCYGSHILYHESTIFYQGSTSISWLNFRGNSIQGEIPGCSPLSVDISDIVVWTVNLDTVELMNLCVQGTVVGQACIEHNDGRGWQVKYMSRP